MNHPLVILLGALLIFLIIWLMFRPLEQIDPEILEGDDRQTFPWESYDEPH